MAKIIITFNEIRASSSLIATVWEAIGENFGGLAERGQNNLDETAELRDMSDEEVRNFFNRGMSDIERKLVWVGSDSLTIDIPEKFVIAYLAKCEKFAIKAAPIIGAMANLAKSFVNVFKAFEKDITKLVKETFGS